MFLTKTLGKTLLLTATLLVLLLSSCTDKELLPPVPLPQSMKGYELYSWQSGKAWRFTLITGTNRLKTIAEITSREDVVQGDWVKITVEGVPDLKAALGRLPPGAQVVWWGARDLSTGSVIPRARLELPSEQLVQDIRSHCAGLGIQLEVSR
ncbi:MAG: hypothetical protein JSV36_17320 [Anaerolineae bacterium]|nr:MAG: hypothetical protein JSV36_17320 [Anaerolineae bacterium]